MSRRLIRATLCLAALGVTAACSSSTEPTAGADGSAPPGGAGEVHEIDVTISDAGCEPRQIAATAGPTTFKVTNDDSAKVTEFEVLDGDRILGEVENVIPGDTRDFSLTLAAGSFVTYCPNGEFEKGTLEVADAPTGPAADDASRTRAVGTYLDFVKGRADELITRTDAFVAVVKAGDVEAARASFASTRAPYEAIEPIAESFGDLDPAIDAREGDVPEAGWGGFHRIEKALFADGTLDGMGPVADKLAADVKDLRAEVDGVELEPAQIANGAVELLNEVSTSKITGEEDRYSHTDLSDFAANLAGSKAAFDALVPLIETGHRDLADQLGTRFADVQRALDAHRGDDPVGNGYALYGSLGPADTRALSVAVDALAEPLSSVAAIVIV